MTNTPSPAPNTLPPATAEAQGVKVRRLAIEEAAQFLDAEADRMEQVWNDHVASGRPGPASSHHTVTRGYAKAIRALSLSHIGEEGK